MEKSLAPVDISPEAVDGFKKCERRLEAETSLVEFFFNFDFQMHKNLSKKDLFSKFCLLKIIVRPFISLMMKSEVYNLF